MAHFIWIFFVAALPTFSAQKPHPLQKGDWIMSGGTGITVSPSLILFNPQLEWVYHPDLYFGPLMQVGIGSGMLVTLSGNVRYVINPDSTIKPNLEGGIGIAAGSTVFDNSPGVNIHLGIGADYHLTQRLILGSVLRLNFAPPLKTMYLSWPIVIGRFLM